MQGIIEFVEPPIAVEPVLIPSREGFGVERGKTQQIIASPLDHIDGEVIPGVDSKIGATSIAETESGPFQFARERGMLDPDQLRDLQEFLEHRHGIDRPKRSEHLAEFESKESVAGQADRPVDIDNLGVGAADEVTALKDDRCSARRGDPVCFFSVVVQTIPGQVLDERAGDERPTIGPIGHKLKDLAPLG